MRCRIKLRSYQKIAVDFLADKTHYALYWEMRVGKSPPMLIHIKNLVKRGLVKKIIILTPPSAMPGWEKHIFDWTPELLPLLFINTLEQFKLFNKSKYGLFLVSYSRIGLPAKAKIKKNIIPLEKYDHYVIHSAYINNIDCIVFDESQNIKNHDAQQTRWALTVSEKIKYKYLLTGTPTSGKEIEYYFPMKVLNPEIFYNFNKEQFTQAYFYQQNTGASKWGTKDILRSQAKKNFFDRLRAVSSSLKLSDVTDEIPKIQTIDIPLYPTEQQKKLITLLKEKYLVKIEDKNVTAVSVLVEITKVLQICNGHVLDEDGIPHILTPNPKKEWLMQNIKEITDTSKVIIWIIYKQDRKVVTSVLDKLKMRYVNFQSGLTLAKRKSALERFKTSPDAKVFIAHPDSAGTGVDLAHAPVTIIFSRNYNWLSYKQAISRNITYGQKNVTIYQLYIKGLLDDKVKNILEMKGKNVQLNLQELLIKDFLTP